MRRNSALLSEQSQNRRLVGLPTECRAGDKALSCTPALMDEVQHLLDNRRKPEGAIGSVPKIWRQPCDRLTSRVDH